MPQKGSAAILATKRPTGFTPEGNLRNSLHTGAKAQKQIGSTWPGPKFQNRGVSGPTPLDPPLLVLSMLRDPDHRRALTAIMPAHALPHTVYKEMK